MSWDERFLQLAEHIAQWSKDPSTKVGAVIVRPDRTVASLGYNGFPRGVKDDANRYEDRSTKYRLTTHAEVNAILSAHEPLHGHTIYVTPLHPCAQCAAAIVQAGITRVVSSPMIHNQRWDEEFGYAQLIFTEADVTVVSLETEPCPTA